MGDTPEQTLDEFGVHQVSPNGEAPKTRSNGEDVTGVPPNEASSAAKPWWRDPTTLPPRQFLYDRHYVRRAIGATIAGGGRGKTTRAVYEAISMAIGRDLATREALPSGPLRVCMWNGEEDQDE